MAKIAIDAHMVGERETGNETYVVGLAGALGRLGGHNYTLLTPKPGVLPATLRSLPHLSVRPFPNLPSFLRIPLLYPRLARRDGIDLLHMTYIAPPRSPCPVVVTVHDVSYRIFPEYFSPRVRLLLGLLVGVSVRRAARVITVSESARRDIVRFYRVPPEHVAVTPEAAGEQFTPQPSEEVSRVREKYSLPPSYILAVGNVQPRKNLARLVEAFAAVASHAPDTVLALAGRSGWRGSEVEAAVRRLGLERRVLFTGYVHDGDLPALYTGATIFCYPSLYEGFGLPPLEAMACGAPTVTSNVASLPEVVGDAALTVEPLSVTAIIGALRRMLDDAALREEYRARGLARAALFSWERTAQLTRKVYDEVLDERRKREGDRL